MCTRVTVCEKKMSCKYSVNSAYVTVDWRGVGGGSRAQQQTTGDQKISLHFVQAPFSPGVGVALYADFNLLRDKGGPGQGGWRLLLGSLSLVSLWS